MLTMQNEKKGSKKGPFMNGWVMKICVYKGLGRYDEILGTKDLWKFRKGTKEV